MNAPTQGYLLPIWDNVRRIYEVRINEFFNFKQMLVGVSCIYAVIASASFNELLTFK